MKLDTNEIYCIIFMLKFPSGLTLIVSLLLFSLSSSTVVTLSGGYLTLNGSVTSTYFDFTLDFQANMEWVAMIWSQN